MAWKTVDGNGGKTEQVELIFWTVGRIVEGTYLGTDYRDDIEHPNTVHRVRQVNGVIAEFYDKVDLKKKLVKVKKNGKVKDHISRRRRASGQWARLYTPAL